MLLTLLQFSLSMHWTAKLCPEAFGQAAWCAGGVVGGVVAAAIVLAVVLLYVARRRRRAERPASDATWGPVPKRGHAFQRLDSPSPLHPPSQVRLNTWRPPPGVGASCGAFRRDWHPACNIRRSEGTRWSGSARFCPVTGHVADVRQPPCPQCNHMGGWPTEVVSGCPWTVCWSLGARLLTNLPPAVSM